MGIFPSGFDMAYIRSASGVLPVNQDAIYVPPVELHSRMPLNLPKYALLFYIFKDGSLILNGFREEISS